MAQAMELVQAGHPAPGGPPRHRRRRHLRAVPDGTGHSRRSRPPAPHGAPRRPAGTPARSVDPRVDILARPEARAGCDPVRAPRYGAVIAALLPVVLFALALHGIAAPRAERAPAEPAAPAMAAREVVTVVVQPGDTVWEIAEVHAPRRVATGEYVDAVLAANNVDARRLAPGTVLRLP